MEFLKRALCWVVTGPVYLLGAVVFIALENETFSRIADKAFGYDKE